MELIFPKINLIFLQDIFTLVWKAETITIHVKIELAELLLLIAKISIYEHIIKYFLSLGVGVSFCYFSKEWFFIMSELFYLRSLFKNNPSIKG